MVLIGGGIMSATLGSMLSILEPEWRIVLLERADALATATGATGSRGGSLGAAAPASLAMKLPEPLDPGIEPGTGTSVESLEQRPPECVPRQRRRPWAAHNASGGSAVGSIERRIRTLLDEQGRGRRHRGRADRLPRPGIVLRC